MESRESILIPMLIMVGLSFILSLLLFWVPVIGGLIGPIVGGYVGGRQAGNPGRAFGASILPALFCGGVGGLIGLVGGSLSGLPIVGLFTGLLTAGAMFFAFANVLMIVAAVVGGAMGPARSN